MSPFVPAASRLRQSNMLASVAREVFLHHDDERVEASGLGVQPLGQDQAHLGNAPNQVRDVT